ncbi:MAG: hypothetical protein E2586_01205 [Novosphingobium sp.]|uniref:hypothetical protein n=1 Tax=Novosphingobium sp. TaxID=1874826 RepID=UPI0012C09835|nr:hypothetical protein [Novosphingobium sp.]MPS67101.1 hypothetical protein [Novosphingobium sp.]
MILVVEGISACGKSTWCAKHGANHTVPENGRLLDVPDKVADPHGAASYWAKRNVDRWQAALVMERSAPLTICDTDPLKLHYTWCLWQIGEADERDWLLELAATRQTVAEGRIGFADLYLVGSVSPEDARARAAADNSCRRRNFDLHVRLQPALLTWYAALDVALPGRVQIGFPSAMPSMIPNDQRYDLTTFDRMVDELHDRSAPTAV